MEKKELVLIPAPGIGHLVSAAEFARRLLDRDEGRLSITVLVIKAPFSPDVPAYVESLSVSDARIRYIVLPTADLPPPDPQICAETYFSLSIEGQKDHIKDAILEHVVSRSKPLAGIVVDFFCTSMIDVANELNVPSYLFFASSAAFLGFMFYIAFHKKEIGKVFEVTDPDSIVSTYKNPVPSSVLQTAVFSKDGYETFATHGSRFKETKGIITNTFADLERYAVNKLASDKDSPPVYPVGPLLDLKNSKKGSLSQREKIMNWLDDQPVSSVVFLCFGSMGSFKPPQLIQMAIALEKSGHKFLWSIRQPAGNTNLDEILPKGFLERTKETGMLCDWAPQVDVLAHKAIGGFVSHCGWNSILESLWYGVPIVTWPLYAEQQINAFEMVNELGLAVELKLDYRYENEVIVSADEIEKAVKSVMEKENPVKKRVQEMKEKSRKAVSDGGSSSASMGFFIDKIIGEKS